MTTSRRKTGEEAPPATELDERREQFLETFFRKGAQFAEDLLKENERLRLREAELGSELRTLKRHLESDETVRELLQRLEDVERQNKELAERFREVQAVTTRYNDRYAEIERELNDLASLYVASYQLHSTLDIRTVVRHIRELLHQLLGADRFAVYLADETTRALGPILVHGIDPAAAPAAVAGEGHIGRAYSSGEPYVAASVDARDDLAAPLACVPMRVEERVVGVIAVFRLLSQKRGFEPLDFELFKLLGAHAATALIGARLYSSLAGRPLDLEEYRDL